MNYETFITRAISGKCLPCSLAVVAVVAVVAVFVAVGVKSTPGISQDPPAQAYVSAKASVDRIKRTLAEAEQGLSFSEQVMDLRTILDRISYRGSDPLHLDIAYLIADESRRNNIDPYLVLALMQTESSFITSAVSHVGAVGLMQVLPDTAFYVADMAEDISIAHRRQLFDPETNIRVGINYLAYLIKSLDNVDHAIIAYNFGPGNLKRSLDRGSKLPSGYHRKVMQNYSAILRLSGRG